MSALLQELLRSSTISEGFEHNEKTNGSHSDEDDEELVNVVSLPGTPLRTRPSSPSRTRPSSPTPRSSLSPAPRTRKGKTLDPLRILPTQLNQRIFAALTMKELAKCALVSRKWSRSQTLNYVWFQYYRKDNFNDESLPPGKWTKRESKQNWRSTHLSSLRAASSQNCGYSSPNTLRSNMVFTSSGYQTPREIKEDKWREDAEQSQKSVSKNEMRDMYKEMGGRKVKGKGGKELRGVKDRAGFSEDGMWGD